MQRKHNPDLVPLARNLRKNMTAEERRLWYDFLRQYPVRFYRQKVLGRCIVDFYCAKAKLVVEIYGSQHLTEEQKLLYSERTRYLEGYGLRVIGVSGNDIFCNFRGVCEYIDNAVKNAFSADQD